MRDENEEKEEDSKKLKPERFPVNRWEFAAFMGVICIFSAGLFCVHLTMPAAQYGHLKLPRTLSDLRLLKSGFCHFPTGTPILCLLDNVLFRLRIPQIGCIENPFS